MLNDVRLKHDVLHPLGESQGGGQRFLEHRQDDGRYIWKGDAAATAAGHVTVEMVIRAGQRHDQLWSYGTP
jgi:hypothetical protein